MSVAVITCWYNEAFMAPFFLRHYAFADRIHVLLDPETDDGTHEHLAKASNVQVHECGFPDGLDDVEKTRRINELYRTLDCDWAIAVDSDEFVFWGEPYGWGHNVQLGSVYPHAVESPSLDPEMPVREQRRHGVWDPMYCKPAVVRGRSGFRWDPGCHTGSTELEVAHTCTWLGAHWQMADEREAIRRRMSRRGRQSTSNLRNGYGVQHHHVTEGQIRAELKAHEHDHRLW
jgi:hypothetical protein